MSTFIALPLEDLATLLYGGAAGWGLLYLSGQFGALAERVAGRRGSASESVPAGPARAAR